MVKKRCPECGAEIEIPEGSLAGDVVSCPDCGLECEITPSGELEELKIEGEDWGE